MSGLDGRRQSRISQYFTVLNNKFIYKFLHEYIKFVEILRAKRSNKGPPEYEMVRSVTDVDFGLYVVKPCGVTGGYKSF